MNEPTPLREAETLEPQLQQSAAVLRALPPPRAPSQRALDAGWAQVLARAHRPRQLWSLLPAGALAAAAGALLVLALAPARPQASEVLVPGPTATLSREASGALVLSAGTAQGKPSARLRTLRTPQGTLSWAQGTFRVAVESARTLVVVEQGEVRWRDATGEQLLRGGATLEVPPSHLEVPVELQAPALPADDGACASREGLARTACLREAAQGGDLTAQNALFELALTTRGAPSETVEAYRLYLRRFPQGALMPEARVQLLVTLAQAGRRDEAREEARAFLAQLPEDALAPAVAAFGRALEKNAQER
jgi:hypothetical protein